jgi:hypothetical protein
MEKTMVLTCILKECKLLCFHGIEKPWFCKPWFFKVIGRKYYEFLENHGFEKPWFFES